MASNQQGQSTIEFIISFALGVSLILVVFNTAINYATGYLVQYATFMASRVYLTSDSHLGVIGDVAISLSFSRTDAQTAFNTYNLSIFRIPNENFKINPAGSTPLDEYLTVGAYTTFEQTIDLLGRITGQKKLELVSESFLGKEPTRAVCATRVCVAITGQTNCDERMDITLYDDGC
jgi:hypothetical protein